MSIAHCDTIMQAEVFEAKCEVVSGELPPELDGVFLRNGSNPFYDPYAGYHWYAPHTPRSTTQHSTMCRSTAYSRPCVVPERVCRRNRRELVAKTNS